MARNVPILQRLEGPYKFKGGLPKIKKLKQSNPDRGRLEVAVAYHFDISQSQARRWIAELEGMGVL